MRVWAILALATTAQAQDPVRPWLGWRTLETPSYRFHYLPELEQFTRDVAARIESVDSAITAHVGYPAPKPVHVVIDDPFVSANGYAIPFLDRAVTVWWATPPDPRNDIGNFGSWSEMLAIHEVAHLAHLSRPSRNPLQRGVVAPLLNVGPITLKAPRWLYEGYATVIEGRLTGSGRPNNVWRPTILRQWAIEGRLPGYGQLSSLGDFNGGSFAYLGGSAFLEWLARREGDSSLVHLWRRMSARRSRSLTESFVGVYGDPPPILYAQHVAELTRDAMSVKATLERAGLREGELVQRMSWATGDPAISPSGELVAITLREEDRPGRLVVWKTAPEPEDTAEVRRRIDALKRDPLDVADRRFYPRRRTAQRTLLATNGRSYQMPRWFADNRRVLISRWTPRGDGTLSPALYVWDTESGDVRRVTPPVGVLHADPHPDGRRAVAMQCRGGRCDIAHVVLESGNVTTLLRGDMRTTYYRPRYSPDGARILASVSDGGRWRVIVADGDGGSVRRIDPDDGVNRYDAEWVNNDTVVVSSERGGITNLERIALADGSTRALTRVTGAAIGAGVNRRDGSIWFLSLHSRGLDVRRLARDAPIADSVVSVTSGLFGLAAPTGIRERPDFRPRPIGPARSYGNGPRSHRWVPGGFASGDGAGAFVSVFSGDIVGRLNASLTGAFGEHGTTRGAAARATWRFPRPAVELGLFGLLHEPSDGRFAQPFSDSLDATVVQGFLGLAQERRGEGWHFRARLGAAAGQLTTPLGAAHRRELGFVESELYLQQAAGARGISERIRLHASGGRTGARYQRVRGSFSVATFGRDALPLQLGVTAGQIIGAAQPFEQFVVGGASASIADSSLFSQRFHMPVFPTGIARGRAFLAWRAALPLGFWTAFYEGAGVADKLDWLTRWNRAVGVERGLDFGPMPAAYLPRVQLRGGAGYTLDAPFRKKLRAFLEMRVEP